MADTSSKAKAHPSAKPGSVLSGLLIFLGVVGGYLALQLWILPSAGVST